MRTRSEIFDSLKTPIVARDGKYDELVNLTIVELLLDIRDLITEIKKDKDKKEK